MKLQIISAVILLSLSQLSFAMLPKPEHCPTVSALKTVGVNIMVNNEGNWIGFVQSDSFSTKENWSFMFGAFKGKNENDAKNQANKAISALTLDKGPLPYKIDGKDSWVCLYKDKSGHAAETMTPPMVGLWSMHT